MAKKRTKAQEEYLSKYKTDMGKNIAYVLRYRGKELRNFLIAALIAIVIIFTKSDLKKLAQKIPYVKKIFTEGKK